MRCINKVFLIGNLTRDPVKKDTQSGHPIVTFGLATNREWITRDNRRMTSAEFHDCVAWAKLGDICSQYLKKGKLVYVEGYLKTRSWTDTAGLKKFRTEIVVQDMIMLEKREKDDMAENELIAATSSPDQSNPLEDNGGAGAGASTPDEGVFEG